MPSSRSAISSNRTRTSWTVSSTDSPARRPARIFLSTISRSRRLSRRTACRTLWTTRMFLTVTPIKTGVNGENRTLLASLQAQSSSAAISSPDVIGESYRRGRSSRVRVRERLVGPGPVHAEEVQTDRYRVVSRASFSGGLTGLECGSGVGFIEASCVRGRPHDSRRRPENATRCRDRAPHGFPRSTAGRRRAIEPEVPGRRERPRPALSV